MAGDHNVRPVGQGEGARHIAGVRTRDSSRTLFFTVGDPAIESGTWVLVTTPRGQEAGRVVVTPRQVVLCQLQREFPPIDRVLDVDEVERFIDRTQGLRIEPREGERRIGGLGKSARNSEESRNVSEEDARYRAMKRDLPRLGEQVMTPEGEGTVVALQVFKGLVTIRYDETQHEERYPADMLRRSVSPGEDSSRPEED